MTSQSSRTPLISVRRFKATDASSIQQILAQSPEAAAWSTKSFEQLDTNDQPAWVVEQNKTVLGFLVARTLPPDEAEILNLAVIPESRRNGAATKLLQTALTELTDRKIRRIHLEVRESNAAAISFYKKHAFLPSGRRPHYYRDPNEVAVLLVRELTA
jgi:ribosomal-protein-alanine acetyltransferase